MFETNNRNIFTGIDIGGDSIKIVILEKIKDNFYCLAEEKSPSQGIVRGLIIDEDLVLDSLKKALSKIEKKVGFPIKKTLISIPSNDSYFFVVDGSMEITNEDGLVHQKDINRLLQIAAEGKVDIKDEVVHVCPITYKIGNKNVKEPKGLKANTLGVKAIVGVAPKKYLYTFFNLFSELGVEILGMNFGLVGDYWSFENLELNQQVGVINIGKDIIDVGVFNKGILIKTDYIKLGSQNIDKDISYTYGLYSEKARFLKETFALGSRRYANMNDVIESGTVDKGLVKINQFDITRLVETRISELLKLGKKAILDLTNKKISYIIITGGLTNIRQFNYVAENTVGINAKVMDIKILGLRDNSFSSIIGVIKFFEKRQREKDYNYSMINKDEINILLNEKYE